MSLGAVKNIVIVVLGIVGIVIATLADFPKDPARPYLLVVGVLIVANINLQYLFGLAMGVTYPLAMPQEHKKRNRVLVVSWLLLGFMVYGFFAW